MERIDYIIDIQAFHDKEGVFLPKEIAVIALDSKYISHWIVKPPCEYSELPKGIISTNCYLTCYHHGIEWYDGESNLNDVYAALRSISRNAQNIYVRGYQKVNLLERVLARHITNLEEYSCPSFKNLPGTDEHFCAYHGKKSEKFACALTCANKLRMWLRKTLYMNDTSADDGKKKKKNRNSIDVQSENRNNPKGECAPTSTTSSDSAIGRTSASVVAESGVDIVEPYYSKPYDEHSSDSTRTNRYSRTDSGSFPSRQTSEGVDTTGRYYC